MKKTVKTVKVFKVAEKIAPAVEKVVRKRGRKATKVQPTDEQIAKAKAKREADKTIRRSERKIKTLMVRKALIDAEIKTLKSTISSAKVARKAAK